MSCCTPSIEGSSFCSKIASDITVGVSWYRSILGCRRVVVSADIARCRRGRGEDGKPPLRGSTKDGSGVEDCWGVCAWKLPSISKTSIATGTVSACSCRSPDPSVFCRSRLFTSLSSMPSNRVHLTTCPVSHSRTWAGSSHRSFFFTLANAATNICSDIGPRACASLLCPCRPSIASFPTGRAASMAVLVLTDARWVNNCCAGA